jgi:HSP20 family protein
MTMVRFDPFSVLREFDRFFDSPLSRPADTWAPRTDVFTEGDEFVVRAEVPGVDPDSLEVTVEGHVLTIAGERSFTSETTEEGYHRKEIFEGRFRRSVTLPEQFDADKISASSEAGILEVRVAKKPEVLPKKIDISVK